jgi:hypothetical protein
LERSDRAEMAQAQRSRAEAIAKSGVDTEQSLADGWTPR